MIYAANWKLNKTPNDAKRFIKELLALGPIPQNEIILFPQALAAAAVSEALAETQISWGLQNAHSQKSGAFTGENSVAVAQEMGARFILVGHSERRALFHEAADFLAEKVKAVQELGLTPIYCIGETLQERQSQETLRVLKEQLTMGLKLAQKNKPLIVAYEPVWAIGTGQVASVAQVAEAHQEIQKILTDLGWPALSLLYGGSVKPENSAELKKIKNVHGFLIGGASLEASSLVGIIAAE